MTAARQAYNKYYKAEIELNEAFNRFASNFCHAYQGPNKASAQIGSKFDTSESVDTVELSATTVHVYSLFSFNLPLNLPSSPSTSCAPTHCFFLILFPSLFLSLFSSRLPPLLSSLEYSDLDDQFKKKGDEYLPLGPSFQEHVACFVK